MGTKTRVGVISNKHGFLKLKENPLYDKFNLVHLQSKNDVVGDFELVIKIHNPGMIDDGASEAVRSKRMMIYNKAALYEWAKEMQE